MAWGKQRAWRGYGTQTRDQQHRTGNVKQDYYVEKRNGHGSTDETMCVGTTNRALKSRVAELKRARLQLRAEEDLDELLAKQRNLEMMIEAQKPLASRISTAEKRLRTAETKVARNEEHLQRVQAILTAAKQQRDDAAAGLED